MKQFLFLFILLFCSLQSFSQSKTVTGTVTNEKGEAVSAASVQVKGRTTGVITDQNGRYSISAGSNDVLQFNAVSYTTQERPVGDQSVIDVQLSSSESNLNDVVVVGYGTQRRGNLTGAVSTVDINKTLTNRPIADVGRGLQGVTPGLSVTIPSGEVGSDPLLKIRGQMTSFQGTTKPLILLDNVEIPSIQIVNPNDIASITVLKDAASSSIYGAKASNGVILITTKKGSGTTKPQINYTNNFSWQNIWKHLKMADVDALRYSVDAAERIGSTSPTGAFYYVDRASYLKAVQWKELYGNKIGPNDPTVFGRDWFVQGVQNSKMGIRTYNPYDLMVREWAPTQQHNLTVGQTIGKTSYNISLGMLDQSGMLKPAKKDAFSRYNASVRISSEINKYITMRAGSIFSRRNKEYAYITNNTTADPWLYLYRWGPLYPFGYDQNGDPIRSPWSEAKAANTANILQNYVNVSLGTTLNFTPNWKFDFDYTFSNQEEMWKRPGTRYTARNSWTAPVARVDENGKAVYVDSTGNVVPSTAPGAMRAYDLSYETYTGTGSSPDHIFRQVTNFYSGTINAFTTYNLNLNEDHNLKFILGLNQVASTNEWQSQQQNQLTDINNPQFNFAVGAPPIIEGDKTWESQLGYFGRINYSFKNTYLLEGNLRYDGSSKFPSRLWWKWYPSFSAGWVLSNEKFMDWSKEVINQLKVRASWGVIGDQTVPNNLYLPLMKSGLSNWIGGSGQRLPYVGYPSAIVSDISWQDIETKNLGVDVSVLRNKVNMTFDVYQRNTKNMIVPLEGIPYTFGSPAPQGNFGSLQTNGWEFSLDFNHRFENGLGINLKGNIADSRTKITEYGSSLLVTSNYNGKIYGDIWGYRTDRLYQMDDFELDANGKLQLITLTDKEVPAKYAGKKAYKLKSGPDGQKPIYQVFLQNSSNFYFGPGDVKFKDVNGDGVIDNGANSINDYGDLQIIGNSTPRYEYGFRIGADYKGIDFSVFFQGVGSREIWGSGFLAIPGFNAPDGAMPQTFADYWRPDNTEAFYPAAYSNSGSNTANNMQIQDRYLLDMSYLRMKNLTVGYSLPESIVKKIWASSFRVYMALENFITWDNLRGLPIDPESINGYSMWNETNYNSGRTGVGTPAFKTISVGLQLNF